MLENLFLETNRRLRLYYIPNPLRYWYLGIRSCGRTRDLAFSVLGARETQVLPGGGAQSSRPERRRHCSADG